MGSSFVSYKDRGFWAKDWELEIWLSALVLAIDRRNQRDSWLEKLRENWIGASHPHGYVHFGLDDVITTEYQRETIIELASQAIELLKDWHIETQLVSNPNDLSIVYGVLYYRRNKSKHPSEGFTVMGEYFIRLLKHEIQYGLGKQQLFIVDGHVRVLPPDS